MVKAHLTCYCQCDQWLQKKIGTSVLTAEADKERAALGLWLLLRYNLGTSILPQIAKK
jgi:hypothetical protein